MQISSISIKHATRYTSNPLLINNLAIIIQQAINEAHDQYLEDQRPGGGQSYIKINNKSKI